MHVNKGQGHLEVMNDTDDEETQRDQRPWLPPSRGAGRGHGLLAASQWSPDSAEVAVGRTTLVDTVPMGYGRPRGDATTCPMDESMTPPLHCDRAGQQCGSRWRWAGYKIFTLNTAFQVAFQLSRVLNLHGNSKRKSESFTNSLCNLPATFQTLRCEKKTSKTDYSHK